MPPGSWPYQLVKSNALKVRIVQRNMNSNMDPVKIPEHILEAVYLEARKSFPSECCGWLIGDKNGSSAISLRRCANDQSSGNHPTKPDRSAETAYVFSSEDVMALNTSLDSENPALIIYHSHPNGQAYLSDTDKEVATSPWGDGPAYPVQQLVVGIDRSCVVEAALFTWDESENRFMEIARFGGKEI